MRNLEFLTQTFEPQDEPGLPTSDERFGTISGLADEGKYAEAADAVEQLVAKDVLDVRLLVFLLYQAFVEDGVPALARALSGLEALLDSSEGAVGPTARKEAQIARSLRWLLEEVASALEYGEQKNTDRWQAWQAGLQAESCAAALAALQSLVDASSAETQKTTQESTARLVRWLRDTHARLEAETEEPPMPPADPAETTPSPPTKTPTAAPDAPSVSGSQKLADLIRKLQAFARLVERKRFEKAALVGDDVLHLVENFDPREYFPEMFSEFGALLSSHVDEITPHWEHKDSVRWRMLEQFYKVDLDRFEEGS